MERNVVEDASQALAELGTGAEKPSWREGRPALPFSELSGDEFEVFCFLLLKREYPKDRIYYYGKTGDAGRDIVHFRSDGTVRLIQCKCFGESVGIGELRAELAKLYTNIFNKVIPQQPEEVAFYVAPDLTSPAASLLDDRNKWRKAAEDALKAHVKGLPSKELLEFANSWWPTWDRENALVLTERCAKQPDLRDQFFAVKKVIDASREDIRRVVREEIRPLRDALGIGAETSADPQVPTDIELPQDLADLAEAFREASAPLLTWPTTLGDDRWLPRDELDRLTEMIQSHDTSTTLLLGPPGCGKSALLAKLGQRATELRCTVLGIKADKLDHAVSSPGRLAQQLRLPALADACVRCLAASERVLVLIDQLDALADLVDLRSERLNALLDLVKRLHGLPNVHVVCSCREFEFHHDSRLAVLNHDTPLRLEPPRWEEICKVLQDVDIKAEDWAEEVQKTLRVPQFLKVFLQRMKGTAEYDVFTSWQEMYDDLWRQKVPGPEGSKLLMDLADMMSEEESFWLPVVRFEDREDLVTALVAEGILSRPDDGLKVGFEHQTLFEHARARAFARGQGSLTSHVLDRQDALFVRPTLWSTLSYLRKAAPGSYATEMGKLNQADLRLHVRYLLIEFLGHVPDPTDQEVVLLLRWLNDPTYRNKTVAALHGNRGWFERLKDSHLPSLMRLGSDEAWPMVWLLACAASFARADCLRLIEQHWLQDEANDSLVFNTLRQLDDWDEQAMEIACRIVSRTEIHTDYVMWLATKISEKRPPLAPRLLATHFRVQLKKLKAVEDPPPDPLPEDASEEDRIVQLWIYDPKARFKQLLESGSDLHSMPTIAEAAPEAFLEDLWPWFLDVLEYTLCAPHDIVREYRASRCSGSDLNKESLPYDPVFDAFDKAIRGLATTDAEALVSFVERWKDYDAAVVQRFLCRGLIEIVDVSPKAALDFLLHDSRRLCLGDCCDEFSDSRRLVAAVVHQLDDQEMRELERSILAWTKYYANLPGEDVQTRFERRKWDRECRLRLLEAIPNDRLSTDTQALVRAEKEALPKKYKNGYGGVSVTMDLVGSPMSTDQMLKAADEDILHLFEELTDRTECDHPRLGMRGGSIQASAELAAFAKKAPSRAVGLLSRFLPKRQERPAGTIVRALGEAQGVRSHTLYKLIIELDARGFDGSDFRDDAAHSLCACAVHERRLPSVVCELLEEWLETAPVSREVSPKEDRRDQRQQSILWGRLGGYTLPHGTYWMMRALTYGYLRRDPSQAERWLAMLEEHVEREESVYVWQVLCEELRFLDRCSQDAVTRFLIRLFQRFPSVRDSRFGAVLLARLRFFLATDPFVGFLTEMRDSQWSLAPQAYGELIALGYLTVDDAKCTEPVIASYLARLQDHDATVDRICVGIAFTAAKLWRERKCRGRATDLLVQLATNASDGLAEAVMSVFFSNDALYPDDHTRSLLNAIAANTNLLAVTPEYHFVEQLEDLVESHPDLVHRICRTMVTLRGNNLGNIHTSAFMSASHITNIALTLQRIGGKLRERGLELFESLMVLGVSDAQAALDELDRRTRDAAKAVTRRRHGRTSGSH